MSGMARERFPLPPWGFVWRETQRLGEFEYPSEVVKGMGGREILSTLIKLESGQHSLLLKAISRRAVLLVLSPVMSAWWMAGIGNSKEVDRLQQQGYHRQGGRPGLVLDTAGSRYLGSVFDFRGGEGGGASGRGGEGFTDGFGTGW